MKTVCTFLTYIDQAGDFGCFAVKANSVPVNAQPNTQPARTFSRFSREDMVGLHRLAFLLTADHAKAEQCFVAGLEDSIRGNPVFRQWARAWSKRAIIQNAIKTIAPAPPKIGTRGKSRCQCAERERSGERRGQRGGVGAF